MSSIILLDRDTHAERMLESYLGTRVKLGHKHSGAPFIQGDDRYVSLSHKNDYLVVALSDDPIGVDIELLEGKDAYYRIARRYFGESVEEGDVEGFFRAWTKREALGKYLGLGLNKEVMQRDLSGQSAQVGEDTVYFVHYIVDGYMITVCGKEPDAQLIKGGQHE
ncbi:MAG: 4'-phosphopantetheinyl transferase superfamily protein [Clostridia bacterium]|nr:4'-phosphopantetheinyl transferase superfamily protein [Clostridia bacterium]